MFFLCVTHVAETELNEKKADQIQEEGASESSEGISECSIAFGHRIAIDDGSQNHCFQS